MPPGEEIIHVLPQEYIVDNEQGIRDPIGMSGIRMEANFHIISGQVTAARATSTSACTGPVSTSPSSSWNPWPAPMRC
jgi:cell division ATPase FtsA